MGSMILKRILRKVDFHQDRYARELDRRLKPGTKWLDLGSGKRLHNSELPEFCCGELARRASVVVGCDLVVEDLRQNPDLTEAAAGDANALPFRDEAFDLVTANMVVEHLPQPARAFGEVRRILRPGGTFLFVTPNLLHPAVWISNRLVPPHIRQALAHRLDERDPGDIFPTYYRANTIGALQRLLHSVGLQPVLLERFQSVPFFLSPAALLVLESLWIRASRRGPLRPMSSNLIGCARRAD